MLVLHISGRFLLTASLRRRRVSHFFNNSSNSCKLYKRIAVKLYTSELREIFEATTYSICYIFLRFRSEKA